MTTLATLSSLTLNSLLRTIKHKPNYTHLRTLGCACYPLFPKPTRHKLQPRTAQCIFLGYPSDAKGYKCLNPSTGQVYLSRNVIFDETHFPYQTLPTTKASPSTTTSSTSSTATPLLLTPTSIPSSTTNSPSSPNSTNYPTSSQEPPTSQSSTHTAPLQASSSLSPIHPSNLPHPTHPMITRAKTGSLKPKTIFNLTHPLSPTTPTSFSQASKDSTWRLAMSNEFNALQSQGTWDLVPPPPSQNILGSKWTYRTKLHANGSVAKHKARLVAQGNTQQYGLDYHETFSPVAKLPTIRVLLTIALTHKWPILQFDISNAFLHGTLIDIVYMHQPPGFKDPQFPHHVCLLKKALYGLKQASRQWFTTFSIHLLKIGFQFSKEDSSLLTYHKNNNHIYILIYVDDILITGSCQKFISSTIKTLQSIFNIKILGSINHFLGINIQHSPTGLILSQSHYAESILSKAGMTNCKPTQTPLPAKLISTQHSQDTYSNPILYRQIVGAL